MFSILIKFVFLYLLAQPQAPVRDEAVYQKFKAAIEAYSAGQFDKAEPLLRETIATPSDWSDYARYHLAQILIKNQKREEAKKELSLIHANSITTKMMIDSSYQLALLEIEDKNFSKAYHLLKPLEKKLRRQELYPEVLYNMIVAEKSQACRWYKKLYVDYPEFDKTSDLKTSCLFRFDEQKERIRHLQLAGMSSKAQDEIAKMRQSKKGSTYDLDRMEASFYQTEGESAKALALMLPYYEQQKGDVNYLLTVAAMAARAGDMPASSGAYYRAYKLAPGGKSGKKSLYQAAFVNYQFQDYDGATNLFNEFVKKFPNSSLTSDAKWYLSWIRYLRGDYQGAYKGFSEFLKNAGRSRRSAKNLAKDKINYWMAMSLYRMGKLEQARGIFENLAKDKLYGYYAIVSQYRLKKLGNTPLAPSNKSSKKILQFSLNHPMLPFDEDLTSRDVVEESDSNERAQSLENDYYEEGVKELAEEATPAPEEEEQQAAAAETPMSDPVLVKRLSRARDLMSLGLKEWALWDLYEIERRTSKKDYLKTLMNEYQNIETYHRSSYIGQVSFGHQRATLGFDGAKALWEFAYPQAFQKSVLNSSKNFDVPSELVWGIMRAESHYKKDVISPVGALGLMQVMPHTGNRIAQMLGDKKFVPAQLLEPDIGIRMGTRYLQRLMKKFEGNVALVAAAYNGGPHRVKSWLVSFGQLDVDEFVEHIPFIETRNYVKKVVSNFQVYSKLYKSPKDQLSYLVEGIKIQSIDTSNPQALTKETWEDL